MQKRTNLDFMERGPLVSPDYTGCTVELHVIAVLTSIHGVPLPVALASARRRAAVISSPFQATEFIEDITAMNVPFSIGLVSLHIVVSVDTGKKGQSSYVSQPLLFPSHLWV
jgi:hypothetical protein